MTRRSRIDAVGALHHIMVRGRGRYSEMVLIETILS